MDDAKALSPRSLAAQAGHFIDPATGAITPPVHPSTTFARDADYAPIGTTTYSRYHNPTYEQVERVAAELDEGAEALVFAAGMAAIAALFETVNTGQHMVAPTIMYHGAQDWL
ncbi:MAG: PLP-dependent transferase, partial [Kiloniellales bacterium]